MSERTLDGLYEQHDDPPDDPNQVLLDFAPAGPSVLVVYASGAIKFGDDVIADPAEAARTMWPELSGIIQNHYLPPADPTGAVP